MKKIILSLFVLILIISFSACSNNSADTANSNADPYGATDKITSSQSDNSDNTNNNENAFKPTKPTEPSEPSKPSNICEHKWGQWKQTVKPTCDSVGTKTRKCIVCSKEQTETLQKLSHKNSDWIVDIVSTVANEGKKHIECIYCKKIIKEQSIAKLTENHKHVGAYYSITKQPTCEAEGVKEFVCSCGITVKTEKISATGHTVVVDAAVAATCESSGLTEGKHCSECNTVIIKQTVTPQKPHTYGSWKVLVQPTETKEGLRHKACTVCALGISETIPSINDSEPSQLNVILFELRNNEYWVTGIQSCTNPFLTIPSTYQGKPVVGISEKAFYNNTILEEVVIPDSVKTCEYRAFYKCTSLKKVVLPSGMKAIPSGMFDSCSQLTEINLPDVIQSIGQKAFSSCTKLNLGSLTLKCALGYNCFYGVSFDTVTIENEVLSTGFNSATINKLVLAEGLKTIGKEALIWTRVKEIILPTTLTTIENSAFYGVDVEKIVLKSSVYLEYGAFNNCKVKAIVIPKGSTFDKNVFMNCDNLETVYYGGTREEWNSLIANYGYSSEDYQFIRKLHVVCADDEQQ